MAINATALLGINNLGRPVTPTFLFRNRFYLQLSTHCPKMNKKSMWEVKKNSRFLSTEHGSCHLAAATRTKRADLQQICNRSVLTKTDQLQTNLSSAESVFSLLQTLRLNTLRDFKTADEKQTNNRSADYLQRLQMICNTVKSKNRIDHRPIHCIVTSV